ncbi:MAG: hypothetical protein AAF604_04760 [Acidobacteriota bacterium]
MSPLGWFLLAATCALGIPVGVLVDAPVVTPVLLIFGSAGAVAFLGRGQQARARRRDRGRR